MSVGRLAAISQTNRGPANLWYDNKFYNAKTRGLELWNGSDSGVQIWSKVDSGLTIDYNKYWNNADRRRIGQWLNGAVLDFAGWQAACNCDSHSLNRDPCLTRC